MSTVNEVYDTNGERIERVELPESTDDPAARVAVVEAELHGMRERAAPWP
jgi:hypothetical protein